MARRLPVYLVLDTSGSMSGDPIEAVRMGVKLLVTELRNDPMALETAYLSVITFNSTAQQVVPLTELATFQEPVIDAGGSTAMGDALEELLRCADRELVKQSSSQKGDYKPLVFLMTDGGPTDTWESAADRVKNKRWNVIACAAGAQADESILKRITEAVVKLNDCQPGTLKNFFKWVSQSIKTTSKSVQQTGGDTAVNLPPPPAGIQIVP